jgi:hypothetical protein
MRPWLEYLIIFGKVRVPSRHDYTHVIIWETARKIDILVDTIVREGK